VLVRDLLSARSFAARVSAALAAAFLAAALPAPADEPAKSVVLTTERPAFYVLVDPGSDRSAASIIAITAAAEFDKVLFPATPRAPKPWAIPEATWGNDQLVKQCEADPNAIGGVVISYFIGDASHFWLLWQTDTTTFIEFGQVVSCNRDPASRTASPVTVATVSQLHGSNGTLWVERRSQTSVPLLSFAAVVALLGRHYTQKSSGSSVTTSIALASVGAAVVGQGLNKDIPGYSQPLRMRYAAMHTADDLIREIHFLCGAKQPDDTSPDAAPPPDASTQFGKICAATGMARLSP
jgi:hypothetical protein